MAIVLLPILLAGGAAAQVMTAIPNINNAAIVAAVSEDDPGYKVCLAAGDILTACVNSFGGQDAILTVAPSALAGCACCDGQKEIANEFSSCADYLNSEAPSLSTQADAYDQLYSICNADSNVCNGNGGGGGGGGGSSGGSPKTTAPSATEYSLTGSSPSATGSSMGTAITSLASLDDAACSTMLGYFSSCNLATPDFSSMGFQEQASCYCCYTFQGQQVWTDRLDEEASSCAVWAKTGEPSTVYPVASTFASFCSKFSDACSGTASGTANQIPSQTRSLSATSTTTDSGNAAGGDSTSSDSSSTPTPTDGAGTALRVGGAAGVVAIAALAIML